jgi:hypothetical protein
MTSIEEQLRKATYDIAASGTRFAVVGGLAVSARAEPRMTRDADFAIAVHNDQEAERIVRAMTVRGYTVVAVKQDATGRMSTVRLASEGSVVARLAVALIESRGFARQRNL